MLPTRNFSVQGTHELKWKNGKRHFKQWWQKGGVDMLISEKRKTQTLKIVKVSISQEDITIINIQASTTK